MSAAADSFIANMANVFAGRRTILPNAHAASKANESATMTQMDTDWASMTAGEQQACVNKFTAASETGAKVRVSTGLTWPKTTLVDPADASDLLARYTM